ncbi:MFS transporter [Herbaspirillum sp. RV1423]|uniref:MFS transporter n=1 Tax=Herbaspirillum sp. RV1423 TaxID=1443993 RepID=UPI00054DFF36|nr:MFS transporter [Herbaspirillum sp. RV1423]
MDTTTSSSAPASGNAPLYWMALGTFAVGAEGFMIAGILPTVAADLGVSVAVAGQLVVAFTAAYALSSPVLTALTGAISRRGLLIGAMTAFTLANLLAWQASGYWSLMTARILLAFAAGLYVPNAMALAGALVAPERRGGALALVGGGITVAVALAAPLGTLIADKLSWRMTFAGVALLAALATIGLTLGLPRGIGSKLPVASLRERMLAARDPAVLRALLTTLLWATGAYAMYTYFALYLNQVTGIHGAHVGYVLFAWGIAAAIGVMSGGKIADRIGFQRVTGPALMFLIAAFLSLAAIAWLLPQHLAILPVFVSVIVWGISGWAFYPAQQTNLIHLAGIRLAPIALSLNASFMYLGFSLGASAGALTVADSSVRNLGLVAAAFVSSALLLKRSVARRTAASAA